MAFFFLSAFDEDDGVRAGNVLLVDRIKGFRARLLDVQSSALKRSTSGFWEGIGGWAIFTMGAERLVELVMEMHCWRACLARRPVFLAIGGFFSFLSAGNCDYVMPSRARRRELVV